MVTNFPSCALTILWSSVEFGDLLLGSSKTFVRESSSNTVSLCLVCVCIRPHAQLLAHSCYIATLAHLLLRAPFATSQVMQCQPRSMWPSRSTHSWSLFSVATPWLLLLSLLSYQPLYHSQTLLCRPPHHVKFLTILPPRRRTSLVPCYLLTWLSRRFPAVYVPHSWMLPCRRHHTVLFPRTFRRSLALAQCPRFQLMRHCRLLHIVLCNLTLPHNSSSRSSSLAGFSQTVLLIIGILFVSSRHQCWAHMWYLCRRLDLNNQSLHPRLRLIRSRSPMPAVLIALLCNRLQVPHRFALPVPRGVQVPPTREPITLMVPVLVLRLLPSPNPTP